MSTARTFNFLRLYDSISPLVTMLKNVISDLKVFIGIYFFMVVCFSLMISILGIFNLDVPGEFRDGFLKELDQE